MIDPEEMAAAISRLEEQDRMNRAIILNLERNTQALRDTIFALVEHLKAGTMPTDEEFWLFRAQAAWLSAGTALPDPHPSL